MNKIPFEPAAGTALSGTQNTGPNMPGKTPVVTQNVPPKPSKPDGIDLGASPEQITGKQASPKRTPTNSSVSLPKRLYGALVSVPSTAAGALRMLVIPFQYNPAELSRSLTPNKYTSKTTHTEYVLGASQSISLKIELQSVDEWVKASDYPAFYNLMVAGLYPKLAALELLLSPASLDIIKYNTALKLNKKGAVPPKAGQVMFVWGPQRVLPVNIENFSIKEITFNSFLAPIRAEVDLTLKTQAVTQAEGVNYGLLLANQIVLEVASLMSLQSIALSFLPKK